MVTCDQQSKGITWKFSRNNKLILKVFWIKPFMSGLEWNSHSMRALTGRPHCLLQPYNCDSVHRRAHSTHLQCVVQQCRDMWLFCLTVTVWSCNSLVLRPIERQTGYWVVTVVSVDSLLSAELWLGVSACDCWCMVSSVCVTVQCAIVPGQCLQLWQSVTGSVSIAFWPAQLFYKTGIGRPHTWSQLSS